jgi:glycosyltransferase involved in cell wall biosynthesis
LAKAFDTQDLAEGIRWILENDNVCDELSRAARQRAVKLWSPDVVVPQYLAVYRKAIEEKSKRLAC